MFRLYTVDDQIIGVTEKLNYIRLHENGSFVLCEEKDAQGIAFNGEVYSLSSEYGLVDRPIIQIHITDTAVELEQNCTTTGITFVMMAEAGTIDAVTIGEHSDLFVEWSYPVTYKEGQIRIDPLDGCLYRVNDGQGHTSQQGWNPSLTAALWTKIADPSEEWPEWSQPIGAHDAYIKGAKVTHSEKKWVSDKANNVWEPGVYGWTEYTETEE